MANNYTFYYQGAFKQYIQQFLRIFNGFQVEYAVDRDGDGKKDRKTCPVHYGDIPRIVANVLHKDDTFTAYSLPLMSGVVTSIEIQPESRMSRFHRENVTRIRESDGARIVNQKLMGVPYRLNMDLSIYTSNNEQMFQLLEQILLLFNPKLVIQKSNNLIDWSYLTEVELLSIASEQNIPPGLEARVIIYTLSFAFDVWLDFPEITSEKIIQSIETNMKDDTFDVQGVDLDNIVIT